MNRPVLHIGFPKTGTTTLQRHLFARHPEIAYLGKHVPGYGFANDSIGPALESLARSSLTGWRGGDELRDSVRALSETAQGRTVVLSSETLLHVTVTDPAIVCRRLYETFGPCRIVVTIREQLAAISSFFGMHGRFGQYLMLETSEWEHVRFPLTMDMWLELSRRSLDHSYLGLIRYHQTLKPFLDTFGEDAVLVLLFEDLVEDRQGFLDRLCRFMDVDSGLAGSLLDGAHETQNLSRRELAMYRISGLLPGAHIDTLARREQRGLLSTWLKGGAPAATGIPAKHRPFLTEIYRHENSKLGKLLDLDLAARGYAVAEEA